jgi:hypothetical protein
MSKEYEEWMWAGEYIRNRGLSFAIKGSHEEAKKAYAKHKLKRDVERQMSNSSNSLWNR